ncbi:RTXE-like protein, partial [Mya arenaria]
MRARVLVQKAEMHGFIGIPDHSFLTWEYNFDNTYVRESGVPISGQPDADNVIFRANSIPNDLLFVRKAVEKARQQKAPGFDSIPYEVFKNDIAISFLHIFFNVCYQTGKTPSDWGKGVLNPIPNPGMADPREPLNYRGLNLAPTMYKLYCSVLNERLSQWLNNSSKIVDEQNGFRKKRSTVDHLSSLSSVVESRIRKKQSTFAAFIDFSKAYDYVNLSLLFSKLKNL